MLLEIIFLPLRKWSWIWDLVNLGQQVRQSQSDQRPQVENQHSVSTWSPTPNSPNSSPLPSLSPCGAALHLLPTARGCPCQSSCSWVLCGREVEWLVEAKSAALAFTSSAKQPNLPLQISCLLKRWVPLPWIRYQSLIIFILVWCILPRCAQHFLLSSLDLFIARLSHINQCYGLKLSILWLVRACRKAF